MKVWLLNPYGPLPGEEWRDYRFTMLSRALAERGHDVRWWTAAFDHHTKTYRAATWTLREVAERESLMLVPTPSYRRNVSLKRLWFDLVFASRVFDRAKKVAAPDVIVAADPPQPTGFAAASLAKRFRVPLVLDCLDLWPESFTDALPRFARPFAAPLVTVLRKVRARNYVRADAAIASCETYRNALLRSTPALEPQRVTTIYLGVDRGSVSAPRTDKREFRLTAIYAGSLGENYDIDTVLTAARLLRANDSIRFLIAGDGPLRSRLEQRIAAEQLHNVQYLGRLASRQLPNVYATAGVGLIPYARWSRVAMPVKLFDYLAAGLPFVSSLVGELTDLARRYDVGVPYTAGDATSLAAALNALANDPHRVASMSRNAAECARQFDRDEQYGRYADIVERVAREHPADDAR